MCCMASIRVHLSALILLVSDMDNLKLMFIDHVKSSHIRSLKHAGSRILRTKIKKAYANYVVTRFV